MSRSNDPHYRFYLENSARPVLGTVVMGLFAFFSGLGVPVMIIGAVDVYVRDRNPKLALILLAASLLYLALWYFIGWPTFRGLVLRWRNRQDIYLAITDKDFIYQDYDALDRLQKTVIPIESIRAVEFVRVPAGAPDWPSEHLIRIRYLDREREERYLDIDFFFGVSNWPKDRGLMDLLQQELLR